MKEHWEVDLFPIKHKYWFYYFLF